MEGQDLYLKIITVPKLLTFQSLECARSRQRKLAKGVDKYQFKVEGLHCGSGVDGLQGSLKTLDINGTIEADFDEERLNVRTKASPEDVRKMIEEAGYKVLRYQTAAPI